MKMPFTYDEKQILNWASKYYDRVYGYEIVDANIEVPEEQVAKARKTIREKFEKIYEIYKERCDIFLNQARKESNAYEAGSFSTSKVTIPLMMSTAGASIAAMGALYTDTSSIVTGASLLTISCAGAALGVISNIRHRKQYAEAEEIGLTMSEFEALRENERAIFKFAKKNDRFPEFGEDIGTDDLGYIMYLNMKMLHNKYLMQDKMQGEPERGKGEE